MSWKINLWFAPFFIPLSTTADWESYHWEIFQVNGDGVQRI